MKQLLVSLLLMLVAFSCFATCAADPRYEIGTDGTLRVSVERILNYGDPDFLPTVSSWTQIVLCVENTTTDVVAQYKKTIAQRSDGTLMASPLTVSDLLRTPSNLTTEAIGVGSALVSVFSGIGVVGHVATVAGAAAYQDGVENRGQQIINGLMVNDQIEFYPGTRIQRSAYVASGDHSALIFAYQVAGEIKSIQIRRKY